MARSKSGSLAGRIREATREQSIAAILDAAEEIFAREGLQGAKVGDIAKRAGIAVGTLYNYFEDRDAIVCALLGARSAALRERLEATSAAVGTDFVAELRAIIATLLEAMHKHAHFVALMLQSEMLS